MFKTQHFSVSTFDMLSLYSFQSNVGFKRFHCKNVTVKIFQVKTNKKQKSNNTKREVGHL